MNPELPWLETPWRRLAAQQAQDRLPHALMISGLPGMGKSVLAAALARLLLCQTPVSRDGVPAPCGQCEGCSLMAAGTHPDFRRLTVPEGKQQIPVDAVRGLIEFVGLSSQYRGARVALVEPADALNAASANALLKTLEEPPPDAVLILVSSRPSRLPVTIRSRCQRVHLSPPPADQVRDWLQASHPGLEAERIGELLAMAHGAPLAAAALLEEGVLDLRQALFDDLFGVLRGHLAVSVFSSRYEKHYDARLLGWIADWLHDLAALAQAEAPPRLRAPDRSGDLRRLASALDLKEIFALHRQVQEALRLFGQVAVNPQLALESLLVAWRAALDIKR